MFHHEKYINSNIYIFDDYNIILYETYSDGGTLTKQRRLIADILYETYR